MKGFIYIAGAFHTVNRSKCGQGGDWIDNDPHFWTSPPTWGICRNDLRRRAKRGDHVFFVLPVGASHPQMIFAYLRIRKIITHRAAFGERRLKSKRMGYKNPNGNIIVDAHGRYSRFDWGVHRDKFDRIKGQYAVGIAAHSKMLTDREIRALAPDFLPKLIEVTGIGGATPFEVISRAGRQLDEHQVTQLLSWLERTEP